ncbi:hypothetical protein [Pusillimonas sp.]|uniref:hypothetical protein n=1 Tax=Pusillimonas sp. TaxID=3040095 RepID=UPI0037C5E010
MSKFNIQKAISKAAKTTNLNEARTGGGGDYTPPATGVPGVRFVAYVELGAQVTKWQNQERIQNRVELVFELHGKKWPLSESGQPQRITVKMSAPKPGQQPHVKSTYYKVFKAMNYEGTAKHFAELLGKDYVATVYHRQDKRDEKKVYAQLNDPNIEGSLPSIRAPFVEDEDGEPRRRKVPEAVGPLRLFLWEYPDADQWASIYLEGTYDDGRSKNKWQEAIMASPDFDGSPVQAMLMGLDDDEDDDVEEAKAQAKSRKEKDKPEPESEDDDDDYDGTNDIPTDDEPAFEADDDEDAEPERTKSVQGKTPRTKNAQVKREGTTKKAPASEPADDDDDDPLGDLTDDEDE